MRIIVYSLIAILLLPMAVLAGTDDSALQVYNLTGDKLATYAPDYALTGDSPYSSMNTNVIQTGNGLQKYTGGERLFTTPGETSFGSGISQQYLMPIGIDHLLSRKKFFGIFWDVTNTTAEIGFINHNVDYTYYSPNMPTAYFSSVKSSLNSIAQNDLSNYATTAYRHFACHPYISTKPSVAVLYYGAQQVMIQPVDGSATSFSLLPTAGGSQQRCVASAVWQNRLFVIGTSGYLMWSQAGVYNNFTSSDTEGGILTLNGFNTGTYKCAMVGTKDALYLMMNDGVYMLSGGDTPATWVFEKLNSDIYGGYANGVCANDNNEVFYVRDGGDLMKIAGTSVTKIGSLPVAHTTDILTVSSAPIGNRYVMITRGRAVGYSYDIYPFYAYIYDTQTGMFSLISGVHAVTRNGLFASIKRARYDMWAYPYGSTTVGFDMYDPSRINTAFTNSTFSNPMVRADQRFTYYSNWLTCDGLESTMKKFHRIEFDLSWDTEEVYYEKDRTNTLLDNYTYAYYASDLIAYNKQSIPPNITFTVFVSKNYGNVNTKIVTDIDGTSVYNTYKYRTITLPLLTIGSSNSIKFHIDEYGGNLKVKAVRIYYTPLGSYKTSEYKN